MPDSAERPGRIRFGDYEADLRAGELRKHGRRLRVTGRPMQILSLLLERPGELLTRKELQEKLWPADTFVDFEHGMNTAVQTLRRALCDSPKKPRFIETLPRRGYRFIAQIEIMSPPAAPLPLAPSPMSISSPNSAGAAVALARSADTMPEVVGRVGVVVDPTCRNFVLVPRDETILDEMEACEAAKDDLGISLLVADGKLLMVACGTRVKILDARDPSRGCQARILGGEFIGEKAFVPRNHLQIGEAESEAGSTSS